MTLSDLKQQINSKTVDDDFKIFIYEDNTFLVNQYISAICEQKNCLAKKIKSIYEPKNSALSLVLNFDSYLNILETDTFDERSLDYSTFENIIVVCKKIDKKLQPSLENYITVFPKLEDWQVIAYMATICPGLKKEELSWLYNASGGDIYKVINELDKIALFKKEDQHQILNELRYDTNSDLFQQSIFDTADQIVKSDFSGMAEFLKHSKNFNYDPIAITTLMLSTYKKLALIKLDSGATAKDCGVTPKQFIAFKNYLYNNFSADKIFKNLEFLTNIDLRLKSSELDLTRDKLLDYIICHMA